MLKSWDCLSSQSQTSSLTYFIEECDEAYLSSRPCHGLGVVALVGLGVDLCLCLLHQVLSDLQVTIARGVVKRSAPWEITELQNEVIESVKGQIEIQLKDRLRYR